MVELTFDREESTFTITLEGKVTPEIVKQTEIAFIGILREHQHIGRLVLINGEVPNFVIADLAIKLYRYAYIPIAIGVYEQSIKRYVIIYSNNHLYDVGQLIA